MSENDGLEETRSDVAPRTRGLVSRPSPVGVTSSTHPARPELADVVEALWVGRWKLSGQPSHTTELLGDPSVHFVFEGGAQRGSRVVGVWTRMWRRTLEGDGFVRGVKLRPGGFRAFACTPAIQLACQIAPLNSVFTEVAGELEAAILGPVEDGRALEHLQTWLLAQRRSEELRQVHLAIALVERIVQDPAMTSVEQLASAAGMGSRALQSLFREHVGASPKWVIRRNRLQEVAKRLERGEAANLADLAAELGYADQAHMARDFKTAVGKSPSSFVRSLRA